MQSEKSDGQRRERGGEESSFHRDTPFPLSISTTDLRIQHISLVPLLFGVGAGERQNLRRAAEEIRSFRRSALDSHNVHLI